MLARTSTNGQKYFQIHSVHGDFVFMDGTQSAYWNGRTVLLGYAPKLVKGHPSLHRSDLEHTLLPLIRERPQETHQGKILVIDPGHGGGDPGSHSVAGGRVEKDLTLDWALRVRALLTNSGWRVYLTRTNDSEITPTNRAAFAQHVHADLFVSLHMNSISSAEYSGIETYCETPAGVPSNAVRGSEDQAAVPNNVFDDQNISWAMRLHQAVLRKTGAADRGVRRARFIAVLKYQKCPAVLVEGGYLSNPREAALLITPVYRQQLAEAVAAALSNTNPQP